jgi:ribosomal-protein-alanine N-acetyltransferase
MKIITPRLILREFVFEDWPAVLAYQSDPRYLHYYAWLDREPEQVQAFVQAFIDQQQAQPRLKFQLAITLRQPSATPCMPEDELNHTSVQPLIGNCGVRLEAAGGREADIGYELAPEHWGNGYATEAARAILDFGFLSLNLERVWAWCNAENRASSHVLEKLGMHLSHRIDQDLYFKDRWWDTLAYEIYRPQWEAITNR